MGKLGQDWAGKTLTDLTQEDYVREAHNCALALKAAELPHLAMEWRAWANRTEEETKRLWLADGGGFGKWDEEEYRAVRANQIDDLFGEYLSMFYDIAPEGTVLTEDNGVWAYRKV